MQFPGQAKPVVGIVFDSDMGERIDAALALALLYGFDGKNEARVISVSVSKSNLKSAAYSDAIGRFYSGPASIFSRSLPVGMSIEGKMPSDTAMLVEPLAKKNAEGAPLFPHAVHNLNDTAEVHSLIRNACTAQHDDNAIVVLAGPATNLAKLLELPGARDILARKVRFLSVACGNFSDGSPEAHVKADIPAAKKVFAEWPTPIVASGVEVGADLLFPGASIEKDFAWSPAHPVAEAYRAYKTMPYDAPAFDMTAVLYAVRPKEGYFKLSDPGTIQVSDDGRTTFTASASGKHRHLIADPSQKERILKTFIEVASAKPVPRQPRFRQQQQQQQKPANPPKPAEAKPQAEKEP